LSIELAVTPRGPYSLPFSARLASDATRTFRDGLLTQVLEIDGRIEVARAWQAPRGAVTIVAESEAGAERLRWILALDDDHSEFLLRFRDDPLLGRASRVLRGLRPVRVPTVAQALLRAFCGQLIEAKTARRMEQTIIRTICGAGPERLHVSGREIYLYCPNGYGRTRLSNTAIEKKLALAATTRNWKSVNALMQMSST